MSKSLRRFKFYQDATSRDVDFSNTPLCSDTSATDIFFGCEGGGVHVLDTMLETKFTFAAHGHRVLQIATLKAQNHLLTLGTEEPGVASATFKIWSIEKLLIDGEQQPQPIRAPQKIFSARYPESEITAMTVKQRWDGRTVLAIGLASGWVYWTQGDFMKDRLTLQKLNAKPIGISDRFCVKGLGINDRNDNLYLYVVTESQTLVFNLYNSSKVVLDEAGGEDHCVLLKENGRLYVARPQAIYKYSLEESLGCFASQENQSHMVQSGRNIAVVTNTELDTGVVVIGIRVFDEENKLIVGEKTVTNVRHILAFRDMILIIQGEKTVVSMREIPLNSKLEALFRRNCYDIAIKMAEAEKTNPSTISYIHHQYADHLYNEKRDYEDAMQKYIRTIGYLEPSYVIRRYLDSQRIQQLALYLEALHERELAIADHTTLLLNCYTKMKDVKKLNFFIGIGEDQKMNPQRRLRVKFEVETAVKVLRTSGYYSHALEVARSANEPHWYVDILLEDLKEYNAGIKFVNGLPRSQAADVFKQYGRALVERRPQDSTACLMTLCVPGSETSSLATSNSGFVASVADFTHLYTERPHGLIELCEFVFRNYSERSQAPPAENQLYHTLFELYLSETSRFVERQETETQPENTDRPGSNDFGIEPVPQDRRQKALELLKRGWISGDNPKYDPEHMLVLCRMYNFKDGLVFLYTQKSLLREVLQVYIAAKDFDGIISACRSFENSSAGGDPMLWSEALQYFSTNEEDCTPQIQQVLEHVEREDVLPPLMVLYTLAKNPRLKLKIVKDYISKKIARDSQSIQRDRAEIRRLQEQSTELKKRIHELKTEPQIFNRSMDEVSRQPLELPAIHFLCKHSFNLKTIEDTPAECPICASQHQDTLRIRRDMKVVASHQDKFFMELKGRKDGFSVVAEWFGRGMLNTKSHAGTE